MCAGLWASSLCVRPVSTYFQNLLESAGSVGLKRWRQSSHPQLVSRRGRRCEMCKQAHTHTHTFSQYECSSSLFASDWAVQGNQASVGNFSVTSRCWYLQSCTKSKYPVMSCSFLFLLFKCYYSKWLILTNTAQVCKGHPDFSWTFSVEKNVVGVLRWTQILWRRSTDMTLWCVLFITPLLIDIPAWKNPEECQLWHSDIQKTTMIKVVKDHVLGQRSRTDPSLAAV